MPGLRVERGADVVLGAVAGARGTLDRFLDRLDDDPLVDHLLAGDAVGDREQFGLVGGNGGGHQSCPSSSMSSAPSVESGTVAARPAEPTSELQSPLPTSHAPFCVKTKHK